MSGIQTHLYSVDEKQKARLSELTPVLQAVRWIDPAIHNYETYAAKVVGVLQTRVSSFTWVGYYRVCPGQLVLSISNGNIENEEQVIDIHRGVVGRAAADGEVISDKVTGEFKSEIAAPVEKNGVVVGVLDIRSTGLGFGPEYTGLLEKIGAEMALRWRL
jgi:putative methionine-R-sulfoxide reductase with GAF domain